MSWRRSSSKVWQEPPEGVRINNGNIPVVSSAGVVGWHNDYVSDGPVVVVGRKGSVGNLTFLDGPAWPIDTAFYIEGNEHIDVQFAYYLMQTLPFRSMNNDSAVPGLNRTEAESLSIRLPDPVSQGSIVSVLSALDDKIAANRCLESAIDSLLGLRFLPCGRQQKKSLSASNCGSITVRRFPCLSELRGPPWWWAAEASSVAIMKN